MNNILKTLLICTTVFASPTMHAAQANVQLAQKENSFCLRQVDEFIFIIHPDVIHIYDWNISKDPTLLYTGGAIYTYFLKFDQKHCNEKLTGDFYKTALKKFAPMYLHQLLSEKEFNNASKEIISTTSLDINKPYWKGFTYLGSCAQTGNFDMVVWLIESKADVNKRTQVWDFHPGLFVPPLLTAIYHNRQKTVKLLLFSGADTKLPATNNDSAALAARGKPAMEQIFDEFYDAKTLLRMNLPHKIVLMHVANIAGISKEIAEYLIGKRVKVEAVKKQT